MKTSKELNVVEFNSHEHRQGLEERSVAEKVAELFEQNHNFFYGYYGHEYIKLLEHTTGDFRRKYWLKCFRKYPNIDITSINERAILEYPTFPPNVGQFEQIIEKSLAEDREMYFGYEDEDEDEDEDDEEDLQSDQ